MNRHQLPFLATLTIAAVLSPWRADAQCTPNNIGQTQLNPAGGAATVAVSDTTFNPQGGSFSYAAQDKFIFALDNNSALKWSTQASPSTIQNFPIPVTLRNQTKQSIFVAGSDAKVRRFDFDAAGGLVLKCESPILGRGATCPADTLTGVPLVQVWQYSNPAFQTAPKVANDDLVYVVTHNMCGDYLFNKIIALYGSTCQKAWTFNPTGNYPMDYGSEACAIDYDTNTIYCGTHLPFNHPQATLWAINSATGTLKWSTNAESIITRPALRNGRIYVATQNASLRAHSMADGSNLWIQPISATAMVTRNPWPEPRNSGGLNSWVFVTDTAGLLHAVTDNGPSGAQAWTYTPAGGAKVTSAPALSTIAGKAWVGQNNGQLHQLNIITGNDEQHTAAGGAAVTVYDPSLDIRPLNSADLNRLTVTTSATGVMVPNYKTYCVPWVAGGQAGTSAPPPGFDYSPAPLACPVCPPSTACVSWVCNLATSTCEPQVAANGSACSDGKSCTCDTPVGGVCPGGNNDHCQSGACVSNTTDGSCSAAACVNVGDRGGCGPGLSCCGSGSCVNLKTDAHNCGACNHDCDTNRFGMFGLGFDKCVQGVCVRDPVKQCGTTGAEESQLNSIATSLRGADHINFGDPSVNHICHPAFSVYNTTGTGSCSFPFLGAGWNNGLRHVTCTLFGGCSVTTTVNESGCGFPSAPPIYPFHGAWPIRWFDGGENSWVLAGNRSHYPSGMGAVVNDALFLKAAHDTDNSQTTSPVFQASAGPFENLIYNQGVVGPVIDTRSSFEPPVVGDVYFGNWPSSGALRIITPSCPHPSGACTNTSAAAPNWSALTAGGRITALAYSNFCFGGCTGNRPIIFAAVGTKIWAYKLPTVDIIGNPVPAQQVLYADITNPALYQPDPDNPEELPITGILSMSADPLYGDLYLEARDSGGHIEDFVLFIPNTYLVQATGPLAFYNLGDMAKSLGLSAKQNGVSIPMPYRFLAADPDGRISVSGGHVVRMTVPGPNQDPEFMNLPIWP